MPRPRRVLTTRSTLADIPALGVGIGFRREIVDLIRANLDSIDWLEVITDQYLPATRERLELLADVAALKPVVPHGVELSIGSDGPPAEAYVEGLAAIVRAIDAPFFTDHLCFTRDAGLALGQLTPVRRTSALAEVIAERIRRVQTAAGVPFLVENISNAFSVPSPLDEAAFLTQVVEHANCGVLLDVTNLFINAANFSFGAVEFLDGIPLDRVVQLHITGGEKHGDLWLDTHSRDVPDEVWDLTAAICARAPVKAILLERDADFPDDFGRIVADLETARGYLASSTR